MGFPADPRRQWQMVRTVWTYCVVASAVLVALPVLLPPSDEAALPLASVTALLVAGAADLGALLWFKALARRRADGAGSIQELIARVAGLSIVVAALPLTQFTLGFVLYFLGAPLAAVAMYLLGAGALVLSRPSLEHFRDAAPFLPPDI